MIYPDTDTVLAPAIESHRDETGCLTSDRRLILKRHMMHGANEMGSIYLVSSTMILCQLRSFPIKALIMMSATSKLVEQNVKDIRYTGATSVHRRSGEGTKLCYIDAGVVNGSSAYHIATWST